MRPTLRYGFFAIVLSIILSLSSSIAVRASDTLRAHADARNFHIGAAVEANLLQNNATYADVAATEFNQLTPGNEMKMDSLQPTEGTFNYTNADYIVNFANTNGMRIHGHVLVWGQQFPSWLNTKTKDRATFLPIMQNHIQHVVQHFGTNIWAWDVVNEAILENGTIRDNIWHQAIGDDYIDQAFTFARQYAPAGVKLFYNDYNTDTINVKSNAVYSMVQGMISRGVPIDGVGLQMHLEPNNIPSYDEVKRNLERFTALGLEVHITELDVTLGTTFPNLPTQAQLDQQKQVYADMTKACLDTPGCDSMTVWGVDDGTSWLNAFRGDYEHPLLFDRSFAKKPAYFGVHDNLATITPTFTPIPPTASATPISDALRIDSGSIQDYTDTSGNLWVADTDYVTGFRSKQNITVDSNDDPVIYQTARSNMTDYNIPVVDGAYIVKLHFAETGVSAPGQRVFNVNVQGTALNNLDIFAETGGRNVAIVKVFNVNVSGGLLNIHFSTVVGDPVIQGIEVLPGGPAPTSTNRPTITPTFTATPLPAGSNLLNNPGFETGISSWGCFGPCIFSPATNPTHTGIGAGQVAQRTANWNGPSQNIAFLGLMVNGGLYNSSIWARSVSGTPTVHVTIKLTDSTGDNFFRLTNSATISNSDWTQLTGSAVLSWTGTLTGATFYVESEESAAPFADFFIDDGFFAVSGATPTPSPTSSPNDNLLVDGGMEQGLANWYCFACTPVAVTSPVHGGTGAIQLTSRTASFNGPAQNIVPTSLAKFTQGGTYTASIWARSASGTPSVHINFKLTDSTGDRFLSLTPFVPINSTDWTQVSGSATITWTGTLSAVTLYAETDESAAPFVDFYVDDASLSVAGGTTATLTPSPTLSPDSNLLVDGGMEQGLANWYCFACTPVAVTSPVHGGTGAIQLTSRTASFNGPAQDIVPASLAKFTQGGTYSASIWARSASGTPSVHINFKLTDSTGDHFLSLTPFVPINSTAWTLVSGSANITWTGTLSAVTLYAETNESAAPFVDFYVDDAFLSVSGGATTTPTPTSTFTPTSTATNTATPTPTNTPTNTATATPTFTDTPMPTFQPPTNTPVGVPTNVPGKIRPKLEVKAQCSPNPASFDVWKVQNKTSHPVTFQWNILATSLHGSATVAANSTLTFQTPARPFVSAIEIKVNGEIHDVAINLGLRCR